jgi:hypothetical protein
MGRWYYRRKATVEQSCNLSIFDLKRWGMLTGQNYTAVEWVNSRTDKKTRILLAVHVTDEPFAILSYAVTDREGNKTDYEYLVSLVTTPCYFGGVRYWFGCPMCGRRVGCLYLMSAGHFLCRHCNDLTYQSRSRYGIALFGHTWRQIEKLQGEIKRWTWRGRPTRKVKRLNALKQKVAVLGSHEQARMEKFRARLR